LSLLPGGHLRYKGCSMHVHMRAQRHTLQVARCLCFSDVNVNWSLCLRHGTQRSMLDRCSGRRTRQRPSRRRSCRIGRAARERFRQRGVKTPTKPPLHARRASRSCAHCDKTRGVSSRTCWRTGCAQRPCEIRVIVLCARCSASGITSIKSFDIFATLW
jgi:hypothetical protein